MTLPITLAKAFAPLVAAAVATGVAFTAAGVTCLASAALLWLTRGRSTDAHGRRDVAILPKETTFRDGP